MKRNEFIGEKKIAERLIGPEILPNQRWKALGQHDFGNGLVTYYIHIAFKDPMSDLWICNYSWDGLNLSFNQHSLYSVKLTREQIVKGFDFVDVRSNGQGININPQAPQPWPNGIIHVAPQYIPNPPAWQPMQPVQGDGFNQQFFTTSNTLGFAGIDRAGGSGGTDGNMLAFGNTSNTYAELPIPA